MFRAAAFRFVYVVVLLVASRSSVLSQDPLVLTFTSPDGSYSLRYPAGWVYELDPSGLVLANNFAALDHYEAGSLQPPSGAIILSKLEHLDGLSLSRRDVAEPLTPQVVASALAQGWQHAAFVDSVSAVQSLRLSEHETAYFSFSSTVQQSEAMVIVTAVDGNCHVFMAVGALDELSAAQPLLLSIVGSLEIQPRAQPVPAPEQRIAVGTIIRSVLQRPTGDDWYFEGERDQRVGIALVGNFDTVLELYAPDGALIAQNDDSDISYSSYIQPLFLPSNGTYRIVARAFSSGGGPYLLLVGADAEPPVS